MSSNYLDELTSGLSEVEYTIEHNEGISRLYLETTIPIAIRNPDRIEKLIVEAELPVESLMNVVSQRTGMYHFRSFCGKGRAYELTGSWGQEPGETIVLGVQDYNDLDLASRLIGIIQDYSSI